MSQPHSEPPAGPASPDETPSSPHVAPDAHAAGSDEHAAGSDKHGHGEALGPIDWAAYGAGVLGILIGLGTAFAFVVATNRLG
jgi:hypothetical protein